MSGSLMKGRAIATKSASPEAITSFIVSVVRIPPANSTVVSTRLLSSRAQGRK